MLSSYTSAHRMERRVLGLSTFLLVALTLCMVGCDRDLAESGQYFECNDNNECRADYECRLVEQTPACVPQEEADQFPSVGGGTDTGSDDADSGESDDTLCQDQDGDGFDDGTEEARAACVADCVECKAPTGSGGDCDRFSDDRNCDVYQELDCEDDNPEIYPGAPELCDGIINNCDDWGDDDPSDSELYECSSNASECVTLQEPALEMYEAVDCGETSQCVYENETGEGCPDLECAGSNGIVSTEDNTALENLEDSNPDCFAQ